MQVSQSIPSQKLDDAQMRLVVTATFTAEPLEEALAFWMEELAISAPINFAPYNQVFQQLLDPSSLLATNGQGVNIICLRVEDWCRFSQSDGDTGTPASIIRRNAHDLVASLKAAVSRSTTPYILCLCPSAPSTQLDAELMACFQQTESWIVDNLKGTNNLHLIHHQDVQVRYPVIDYYDPQRDRLGHIPFTAAFFTAIGTAIARKIYAIKSSPHKVIVLDCDNTLWKGVVGEDGVQGIDLSSTWQCIQAFMVAQQQAGMLLCLCSKNNEADVMEVFAQRQDMTLKLEHLVGWRVNWLPKSVNIKALAAELNLGLDSFIFIDDNPVECAEVSVNCPEVLTLQLPSDGNVQEFLDHIWAFDHLEITAEDAQRTALYQQNLERQRFQQQSLSLEDFLSGLEMTIDISEPTSTQLSRVAQLTQRTNQFNFTTIRRTEAEIKQLMESGVECRAVMVRDRFGDYGLVGMMLFSRDASTLQIDTFLLSCRVLGRGVEHQMMRYLAAYGEDHRLKQLHVSYVPTQKNQPALSFLEAIAGKPQQLQEDRYIFQLTVQQAAAISYTQGSLQLPSSGKTSVEPGSARIKSKTIQISKSQKLRQIALELYTPQEILASIQRCRRASQRPVDQPFIAPQTTTEKHLATLWGEVLGIHPIGITDNYFDLGGTSLQAVELFAKIERYFSKKLPLTSLLEAPTLEALAQRIDANEKNSTVVPKGNCVIPLNIASGSAPSLFLIHPGGGDVLLYRNLAQRLQPVASVYGIKPCSRNGYSIVHTTVAEMAAYYIEEMRTIQPEGPYLIGGFCAGGAVAFEMAVQLQQQGISVPLVALMNAMDAQEDRRRQKQEHQGYHALKHLKRKLKTRMTGWVYRFCLSAFEQAPPFMRNKSVFSICATAAENYRPSSQFEGKLLLFRSKEDVLSNLLALGYSPDPQLGWGTWAMQGVNVYENEGDFHGILQEPAVKELAEQLQLALADFALCELGVV